MPLALPTTAEITKESSSESPVLVPPLLVPVEVDENVVPVHVKAALPVPELLKAALSLPVDFKLMPLVVVTPGGPETVATDPG